LPHALAMLTSELAIVEYKAGLAIPDRLIQSKHRHYLDYAGRMLAVYRNGIGKRRRQLHRTIEKLFLDEPDCPVRRIGAFCKLLDEKSTYQTDPHSESARLRLDVFSAAAHFHPLVREPDQLFEHNDKKTKQQIADELGMSPKQIEQKLYADVMAFQRLEKFEGYPDTAALLSRYNVAQLQACLYHAESMTVATTDDFKTILRYAKLARLLHEIEQIGPSEYRIIFSGPASILRQTRRYGVNFAKFLPALLACKGWQMEAVIKTPWNKPAQLTLSSEDGFSSHLPAPSEFDSRPEETLAQKFGQCRDGWQLIREGKILHDRQTTFVPDFVFRHADGTEVFMEIVGFWTPQYLEHKRQTLRRFHQYRIIIALPEKSLREGASIKKNVLVYKTVIKLKPLMEILEMMRIAHPAKKIGPD